MTPDLDKLSKDRRDWLAKFWANVTPEPNTGCWLWMGHIAPNGYGKFTPRGETQQGAHRIAYEAVKGPITSGLHLDHLCRVRSCVNPDHLEAVSAKDNVLRGVGLSAINAAKTHCKRGHELAGENLLMHVRANGSANRECRECYRVATRMNRRLRKAAA